MKREYDDDRLPMSKTPRVSEDVRRELAFHFEQRVAELMQQGLGREDAERTARRSFGDAAAVEAECRAIEHRRRRAVRRTEWLGALRQDIVIGLRVLRKSPAFTLTAVLTLALGTGAVAAIFSIVNGVLLRPLPYAEPDRLVTIEERHQSGSGSLPWANFLDLEQRSRSFTAMTSLGTWQTSVLGTGEPLRVRIAAVSKGFFQVFPVRPYLGRLFLPAEHRVGAPPAAVVSYEFWRDRMGSPASLQGKRLRLSWDVAVVGVLPPGFAYPAGTQIYWPHELMDESMSRTSHNWDTIGRLRPGVTTATAERELAGILAQLEPLYAPDFDATGAEVVGLQQYQTGNLQRPLLLLFAASAVFLLAACTNLASGVLARGTARQGELMVRSALGATRSRLARQLLTESALLAGLGSLAGLAVAMLLLRALLPLASPVMRVERTGIDATVGGFAIGVAVLVTVSFGLLPALRLSRASAIVNMRETAVGTGSVRRMRTWNLLVGAEVALAVALLAGSVLLIKSFARVMETDLGFEPRGAISLSIDLPDVKYSGTPAIASFHLALVDRLTALPGVRAAGFVNRPPLGGNGPTGSMVVEGKPLDPSGRFTGYAIYRVVGGEYFRAMSMRVIRGRSFGPGDDAGAPRVALVDEAFAKREWPNEDPIGKRLHPSGMDRVEETWHTVVGVVPSVRSGSIIADVRPTYYFDHRQRPPYRTASVMYSIRTTGRPENLFSGIRDAVRAVDPEVPVVMRTMPEYVAETVADRRFTMIVLGAFGALALVLSLVGIYGVVSYTVAQRVREIGVRRALGATGGRVSALVLRTALGAVVPGLVVGAGLALLAGRAMSAMLYGVQPSDLPTLMTAVTALGAAAVVASLIPAWRAVRVDPLIAMRSE